MLKVRTLEGKEYILKKKENVYLKNEGTYGNGSIDWSPRGLYVEEIAQAIGERRKLVAARCNGMIIPLHTFIDKDCTLQFISIEDDYGKRMMANTAKLLVVLAMMRMQPEYEYLKSDTLSLYSFNCSRNSLFSKEELDQINHRIDYYLKNDIEITTCYMNHIEAIKQFAAQGQVSLAKYLLAQDYHYPLKVHKVDEYIFYADDEPLVPFQYISSVKIISQEIFRLLDSSVIQLSAKII